MILSVITINLNDRQGLEKTIRSVISQSFRDFEWIIIDGDSSDGSKELIWRYSSYTTVWKSEPDKGIYDAMNKGTGYASGRYLLFLNSGDVFAADDCLEKVVPRLRDKDFYTGYELSEKGRRGLKSITNLYLDYFLTVDSLPHQATFIRKETLLKFGLYDTKCTIVSDWWFCFKALVKGNATIELLDTDICRHDLQGISHTRADIALQERIQLLKEEKLPFIVRIFYSFYRLRHRLIPLKVKLYSSLLKLSRR